MNIIFILQLVFIGTGLVCAYDWYKQQAMAQLDKGSQGGEKKAKPNYSPLIAQVVDFSKSIFPLMLVMVVVYKVFTSFGLDALLIIASLVTGGCFVFDWIVYRPKRKEQIIPVDDEDLPLVELTIRYCASAFPFVIIFFAFRFAMVNAGYELDLPLILFVLVVLTGCAGLYDVVLHRSKRVKAVEEVDQKFSHLSDDEKIKNEDFVIAYNQAASETAITQYSKSFFPILLIVFVLRSFVVEPFQIPSGSMIPTLLVGDYIAVNKFAYGIRLPVIRKKVMDIAEPKRGDVVVFFPPGEDRYFIKRLVGLPGDVIHYEKNQLYINGDAIEQKVINPSEWPEGSERRCSGGTNSVVNEFLDGKPHLMQKCSLSRSHVGQTWKVPDGHYFMMGDNRDNSSDSREWKYVPEENLVGKAFAVWMHWQAYTGLPSFHRAGTIE